MRIMLSYWMTWFRDTPELISHFWGYGSVAYYAPNRMIFLIGYFNQTDTPACPNGFMFKQLATIEKFGGNP